MLNIFISVEALEKGLKEDSSKKVCKLLLIKNNTNFE
jgi:hypothetical protein